MWPLAEGRYLYRPLKRPCRGWDVWAWQKCLLALGESLPQFGADGDFGAETDKATRSFQRKAGLGDDGVAGVLSQRAVCRKLADPQQAKRELPNLLLHSQVEAESSNWVGNYTAPYANGKRDIGVVMLHLLAGEETCRKAFDAPERIKQLAEHLRARKNTYYGQPGAKTHTRAWQLAAGSWNAPAWTDKLASGGVLRPDQSDHIESYIQRVTAYATSLNVP